MDRLHQRILKSMRKSIVDDIDVFNGITNRLRSDYVLYESDIMQIRAGANRRERAEILLDILPSRGANAFDIFRESLRHHYDWLSTDMERLEAAERMYYDARYYGHPNLPPMSPLTVIREEKDLNNLLFVGYALKWEYDTILLKSALTDLVPGGYVVLHGMKGFGKSSLTASTLKDMKLIRRLFHNEIYWLKFSYERPMNEEILTQLAKLYNLVRNLEIVQEPLRIEPLADALINFLSQHFNKPEHNHALLVLDDVCSEQIIDAFDFQCKTIVITSNIDVLQGRRATVLEMNDGFTEAESLGLFAKVLEMDVSELPIEAKRIHEECKGMPLLIAMFTAQFEEYKLDMRRRPDRWRYYLRSLRTKSEKNKIIRIYLGKQDTTFNICIQQLPEELQSRYRELAIFREDVNIMPQTLEILWDGCPFEVEEMMLELCHKSLAAKQWNDELHTYIYGIHDLLLCYLRKNLTDEEKVKLHRLLVEKYRQYCSGDFSRLPSDNYSYSYIGHHLEQAKLFNEFPVIYLNFKFLESMITQCGLSNLLIDIDFYGKYIAPNDDDVYKSQINDLERFLEEQASAIVEYRRRKCFDLVQIAMSHPYSGYVKENATNLARERSKNLYVLHDIKFRQLNIPFSEEIPIIMTTLCFMNYANMILIGGTNGELLLWDNVFKKQKTFHGFNKKCAITKIIASANYDCFLALADSGILKLFKLHLEENSDEIVVVQSPKQKQSFWSSIFTSKVVQDDSSATFSIPGEFLLDMTFGHESKYVVASTNKGMIRVWDVTGKLLTNIYPNPLNTYLKCVTITTQSNMLHTMDEATGCVISYNGYASQYNYISQYNPTLQGKKIIFFRHVPERNNSLFIVTETKAIYVKWFKSQNNQMHSYNKQVRAEVEGDKTVYICAALTGDGQYLVLADSASFINVWNTDVGYQPIATYKARVTSLDTYWMKEDGFHIICGTDNQLLQTWNLPIQSTHKPADKPLFDARMKPLGKSDIIAIGSSSNTILTLNGDKIIAESEQLTEKMAHLLLSPDGKKVVYATQNGVVSLFDVETKQTIQIFKFEQPPKLIQFLNIDNNEIIVCRTVRGNLKVWQNAKITYLVKDLGPVISIHEINKKSVITISEDCFITVWNIDGTTWLPADKLPISETVSRSHFSCLSCKKNLLAVLCDGGEVAVYKLREDTDTTPAYIHVEQRLKLNLSLTLTCCEISQDEVYLAIGFENGDLMIIDIMLKAKVHQFKFHVTPVTQLYWAPCTIGMPILLSVNADELAWWNISLVAPCHEPKRKSRLALNRSISTPAISRRINKLYMPTSQSVHSNVCGLQRSSDDIDTNPLAKYWRDKNSKSTVYPALLNVVDLPANYLAKICVSADFTKFLTVDIYGSISTFTLFGYPVEEKKEEDID